MQAVAVQPGGAIDTGLRAGTDRHYHAAHVCNQVQHASWFQLPAGGKDKYLSGLGASGLSKGWRHVKHPRQGPC